MRRWILIAAAFTAVPAAIQPANAEVGYTYDRTALRSGPGKEFSVLAWIPGDTKIDLRACKNSWCVVRWNGISGYASAWDVDDEESYEDCVMWDEC